MDVADDVGDAGFSFRRMSYSICVCVCVCVCARALVLVCVCDMYIDTIFMCSIHELK